VFSFADVMHLLSHKFSGLRGWSLALALIATGAFECPFFRHKIS
jgi:hypothetical protein